MRLGIVGHEAAKFTPETEEQARQEIRKAIHAHGATEVVSGSCHLGGIDIWAVEEANKLGLNTVEFAPQVLRWDPPGKTGFKLRNLQIAKYSDVVLCIVVEKIPHTYTGMRFNDCYHCQGRNPPHIKSGGCWTAWRAKSREWVVL